MNKQNISKKSGQLFELDLVLALILLVAGFLFLRSFVVYDIDTTQTQTRAQDVASLFDVVTLQDLQSNIATEIQSENPVDFAMDNSLAKQLVLHYINEEYLLADQLLNAIKEEFLPSGFGLQLRLLSGDGVYTIGTIDEEDKTDAEKKVVSRARSFVSGFEIDREITGFSGSLYVSSPKHQLSSYAYLGGFVGQGNITVSLSLPSDAETSAFIVEGDFHDSFNLHVNNNYCTTITIEKSNSFVPIVINEDITDSCIDYIQSGLNNIFIEFIGNNISNQFVGGGFFQVDYTTEVYVPRQTSEVIYTFPRIDGVFNLYDAITVPGTIESIEADISYFANHSESSAKVFFAIGDHILFTDNSSIEAQQKHITSSEFQPIYDLNKEDAFLLPIRMGFQNLSDEVSEPVLLDVVVVNDESGSMSGIVQQNGESITRMDATKSANKEFVDIVLGANEQHRIGLIGYSTSIVSNLYLTSDENQLDNQINAYEPNGWTCIACGIAKAITQLEDSSSSKIKAIVIMSDGETNRQYQEDDELHDICPSQTPYNYEQPAINQALCLARYAYEEKGIPVYTVAFGYGGLNTMNRIAEIAGTEDAYYAQSVDEFISDFEEIASRLINQATYTIQVVNEAEHFTDAYLSDDSFIKITYTPDHITHPVGEVFVSGAYALPSCNERIQFPSPFTPISASVLSYSGGYWTDTLTINENGIFDLRIWGDEFIHLGDPFVIPIHANQLANAIDIDVSITDADGQNSVSCSPKNSLRFTASVKSVFSTSRVYSLASGCTWDVSIKGESHQIPIPADYDGEDICEYAGEGSGWNTNNVLHVLGHDFLKTYDLNGDFDLDISPLEFNLKTNTQVQSEVPFLWGPAILEVTIWQ